MPNLIESPTWDAGVYEIATSDPVLGGLNGPLNKGPLNLANRTQWLKARIGIPNRFDSQAVITSNTTIDQTYLGKQIKVIASNNLTLTIAAKTQFTINDLLHLKIVCVTGKTVTISFTGGDLIEVNGEGTRSNIYLLDGEYLKLLVGSSFFEIDACSSSIWEVGMPEDGYRVRRNTGVRNGVIANRVDYARIWDWIQRSLADGSFIDGQHIVDDTTWNSSQTLSSGEVVYPYKGLWSKGNNSTTFRFPDDRGLFTRYLDMGRGMDTDRIWNYPGGYEHDQIKAHTHGIDQGNSYTGLGGTRVGRGGDNPNTAQTVSTGGGEERPKNNAKIPLIKL